MKTDNRKKIAILTALSLLVTNVAVSEKTVYAIVPEGISMSVDQKAERIKIKKAKLRRGYSK